MKTKYFLGIAAALCFLPISAHAECSSERIAELNKIANNVQVSYDYEMVDETPKFKVTVSNLTNDIYMVDDIFAQNISGTGDKVLDYASGTHINFTVYSNDNNCKNEALTTKYVNLPAFNYYYYDERCKDNSEYNYCKMWVDTSKLTDEEFAKGLEEYKNKNKTSLKEEKKENKKNGIIDFIDKNKTILFLTGGAILVVTISVVIVLLNRKRKKELL